MSVTEVGYDIADWIELAQNPVARSCGRDNRPLESIKVGKCFHQLSD